MKRDKKPTEGRIAFEFVSPNGIPDGDELHVTEPGALVLHSNGLWSVIGSENAEEVAIEVLRARGQRAEELARESSCPTCALQRLLEQKQKEAEALRAALQMADRELQEHNREYSHVTGPEKFEQIASALRAR